MEAILDSNFVISCVKRKIDFISELKEQGFKVLAPRDVLEELKDLRYKVKHEERSAINIALQMLEKSKLKKIKLPKGKVDDGLINLGKKGAYIATLDSAIRRIVPNKIGISSAGNSVKVER